MTPPTRSRVRALDGLRGITILLVVVGHAGNQLWSQDSIQQIPLLRGFFGGGAVVIFFVVGGMIVSRTLLRERADGTLDPFRFYTRRLVRLGVQLVPLALAILLMHHLDPTDTASDRATNQSLLHMLTFTLNDYVRDNLLDSRNDIGALWYLSVQQQCYLVLPLAIALFAARKRLFGMLLVAIVVLVTIWRYRLLGEEGWVIASTATESRADGLVLGVLMAVILPRALGLHRKVGRALLWVSAIALALLMAILQELPDYQFLHEWGIAFNIGAAGIVLALFLVDGPHPVTRFLSAPSLAWLGRASLAIYLWHLPIIMFVARHTPDWGWLSRTTVGLGFLAAVVAASHRWIEEPTRRWLETHLRPVSPTLPLASDHDTVMQSSGPVAVTSPQGSS